MSKAPFAETRVTFGAATVSCTGRVVAVVPRDVGVYIVVTDTTCFHPEDHSWPDQPGDTGLLDGMRVIDCITGAISDGLEWRWGPHIPARRGDPGWTWVAGHVVDDAAAAGLGVGQEVRLAVDAERRLALSAGHTACHLSALALNAVLTHRWTKPVERLDSLGHPDFDAMAVVASRVIELGARDTYRLGRSLRRRGLPVDAVLGDLPGLAREVDEVLRRWVDGGRGVIIRSDGEHRLTARRIWTADLPDGWAEVPCGGTHLPHISALEAVRVAYEPTSDGFLAATSATLAR